MRKFVIILLTLLSPSLCFAGWIGNDGKPVPDQPNRKSTGTLGVQLVLTDQEKLMLERWNNPTETVSFPTTDSIEVNQPITAFIIFSGCGTDAAGNCNLVAKQTLYHPDGTIYAELPFQEVWVGKPVPPDYSLEMGVAYLTVAIKPDEPLGEYRLKAEVVDKVLQTGLILESTFTVIEQQ